MKLEMLILDVYTPISLREVTVPLHLMDVIMLIVLLINNHSILK